MIPPPADRRADYYVAGGRVLDTLAESNRNDLLFAAGKTHDAAAVAFGRATVGLRQQLVVQL